MIKLIQPLHVGNAIRLTLDVPASSVVNRKLLRRTDAAFTGHDDSDAVLVFEGLDDSVLDRIGLTNGTTYHYREYLFDGTAWTEGETESVVPQATYVGDANDVLVLVRDRLILGLKVEIERQVLRHKENRIPVLTAPPLFDQTPFPVVSVHLNTDMPGERGIGDTLAPDIHEGNTYTEIDGWLAHVELAVVGWSLNPDERNTLRRAIKRVVMANLPVLYNAGLDLIDFSQRDTEDFGSYPAPVYQSLGTFTCLAPAYVTGEVGDIDDVTVECIA